MPAPTNLPPLLTLPSTGPSLIGMASSQSATACWVQSGMATVRRRPPFPTRSTKHQRPSRCCSWSLNKVANSSRRRPALTNNARSARSRLPFKVFDVRQTEQLFGLRTGQPVPCPGSQHLGPFDRADLTDLGFRQQFLRPRLLRPACGPPPSAD
jgi:hypothetical protein